MPISQQHLRRVVLTGLAVLAGLSLFAVGLRGQTQEPAAAEAEAMARTWRLIAAYERELEDVTGLAEQVVNLSPEQQEQVRRLRVEHEQERARLLAELRRTYAARLNRLLTEEQRRRYEAVFGALEDLARATDEARGGFLAAVGAEAAGLTGRRLATGDLTRFLDVDEPIRRELSELRRERDRAIAEAARREAGRAGGDAPEPRGERRREARQARREAEARYQEQVEALLDAQQLDRLHAIEAAAMDYSQTLRSARQQAYDRIIAVMAAGE